ncbi:hypothetical protein BABINDRAFT_160479 [Babjeviella inositovora NRRL Y-12698]|uniref:Kinetochore protein NDC80 n=1 Tax=Babjeviella inositovora NRRL Y-12698 TaxID=984486 RepID=A0A1E3QU34_9ASCO|nr:uncharacterized protein BABINDRAFT_160479 [Babjeviella inositovora NRRL Y-12698]ODQ81064.1 hypothetical protein BABINDRAFT_160479 [Babjeviella inositovora NRRL Y-12698]
MSDYSYKRQKADTYGSGLLAAIDLNTGSSIPQPSSLKSRLSLAARANFGASNRQSITNNGLFAGVAPGSARRKSIAMTPGTVNRRSSMVPNSASHTPSAQLFGSQGTLQSKDPRPLRDKTFLQAMQQEILNFLITNRFEIVMKHPISTKTLRQPTQKDFVLIFQFLYCKIDEGYLFSKSIEHEVFLLLKIVKYPYLDSINKSQISAVGGQNWPVFLGMLYWLVKLNVSLDKVNVLDFENCFGFEAQQTDGSETPQQLIDKTDDIIDGILSSYIFNSYKAFLRDEDEFSSQYKEAEKLVNAHNQKIAGTAKQLDETNDDLLNKLNRLTRDADVLTSAEQKSHALEGDLVKFKAYIDTMEQRKLKWASVLEKIKTEIANTEKELSQVRKEEETSAQKVQEQGLSPADIDRMSHERSRLSKSIDSINVKLNHTLSVLRDRELEATSNFESLEAALKKYNTTVYKIQSLSSTSIANITPPEHEFEIRFTHENMLGEDLLGVKHDVILDKDLKSEKVSLLNYRTRIASNIHKHQDEAIKLQEKLDLLSETVNERNEAIETLEARVGTSKITYDEVYESMNNDSTTSSTEVEKLERELQMMKMNATQGSLRVEQRAQSIKIEHDQLVHLIQNLREQLHSKVEQMIEYCISFKLNIQGNLEDFETFVLGECEQELSV